MSLPRSTYYARPDPAKHRDREQVESQMRSEIEEILTEFPAYGYRRVTHELKRRGRPVNHKRVARIMRAHALTPRRVKRFLATTDSEHDQLVYPNLLPTLQPQGPDQLWVADLTYIRLDRGFVFLAVVLDAWSRRVVGYAISRSLDGRLCVAALEAALDERRPAPGLVHHSDRGVQYASKAYREILETHGLVGSMSRRGNPYDNAQIESFFKTLKHEEILAFDYQTMQDLLDRLPFFLEEIYNRRRLHSSLGYMPPHEYEMLNSRSAA